MVKIVLCLLITLLVSIGGIAQTPSPQIQLQHGFQLNFIKLLHYPDVLKNSCTPTYANLLIDIGANGAIENLLISDSAPQPFKVAFDTIKSKLNLSLIKKIIADRHLHNCGIIIPVFYVYAGDYCTNSFVDFNPGNYILFQNKTYDKLTFTLEPIYQYFYKPVR